MNTHVSIITATVGRLEQIDRLLTSLAQLDGYEEIKPEIIIANNSPDESQALQVEALVAQFAQRLGHPCRHVRERLPGKCRAQNRAIELAQGSLMAFLDDDVEVTRGWLRAVTRFFFEFPYPVMQGAILMRDQDRSDPAIQEGLYRFRTIDFIDYGWSPGTEIFTLTGGNMAMRRMVFDRIGLFNEKLGPGRSGISEDVEFARRLNAAGFKIGYEPRATVYNEMDRSRLSEEFFRLRHELQGRSRFEYKQQSLWRILPNLTRSILAFAWYACVGDVRRKYRSKGRYFHYRAMLAEKAKRIAGSQV